MSDFIDAKYERQRHLELQAYVREDEADPEAEYERHRYLDLQAYVREEELEDEFMTRATLSGDPADFSDTPSYEPTSGEPLCGAHPAEANEPTSGKHFCGARQAEWLSVFGIRASENRERVPESDLLLEASEAIAAICLRDRVTMPADLANPTISMDCADSGGRLPGVFGILIIGQRIRGSETY